MPLPIGNAPGVYIRESSAPIGANTSLTLFDRCYMIGTATTGTDNVVSPELRSLDDFIALYGNNSPSLPEVRMFFRNDPYGILHFIKGKDPAVSGGTPDKRNYIYPLTRAFDPDEHKQGFLITGEAFRLLTVQADRTALQSELETLASKDAYNWSTLIDCATASNTNALLTAEADAYASLRGHSAFYAPYLTDLEDATVAPTAAVAAIGTRRMREQGFAQPQAGSPYQLVGVKSLSMRIRSEDQEVLNPKGVNCIRKIPDKGILVYGARTLSKNTAYRFVNTRNVLNILGGSLRRAYADKVFSSNDGRLVFTAVRQIAEEILFKMWEMGAFVGSTPGQAFLVICDSSNNKAEDIDEGAVRIDIYATPVTTTERMLIQVNRTKVGDIAIVAGAYSSLGFAA